jgi:hypothetical protein
MRIALAAGVFASFGVLPYLVRPTLLARGTPTLLAWFGATSLLGIAASFIALLAATVSPGPLPLIDLPEAVEVCIAATTRLVSHPLRHWPSILAAVLLLVAVVRIIASVVLTWRDGHRAQPPRARFAGEEDAIRRHLGTVPVSVRLLPSGRPIAFTTGVLRPITVLSEGLILHLHRNERAAVLAHELAHASRGHTLALWGARVLNRAFGLVPGIRASIELLVTALEARADQRASVVVGDPLVVARALATTARLTVERPAVSVGISGGEVTYRIRHLTVPKQPRPPRWLIAVLVLVSMGMLLAQGVAWSTGQRALSRERLALALHDTCHSAHEPVAPA